MNPIKTPKPRSDFLTRGIKNSTPQKEVAAIIEAVRERGDAAVLEFSRRFDDFKRDTSCDVTSRDMFRIKECELKQALDSLDGSLRAAMERALKNISAFANAQRESLREIESFSPEPGIVLGQRFVPVDSCLCYVPGGSYPLFSTALMLVAPAKAAGVRRIAACSPVMRGTGSIHPVTLAALAIAGASEVFAVGGAQAIAAFAYGTETIAPCDLIVGPGNAYIAEAKRQCYGQVGIDFVAGPSEVLVIADERANPKTIASDLLAQCEHDKNAQALLVTTSAELASAVIDEVEIQLKTLSTSAIAGKSWEDYGGVYTAGSLDEAAEFANSVAPEHLELQTRENERIIKLLRNYGALFDGDYAAEVFGDYAAGTNHTLPTMRASRYTGGVGVQTFLKTLCFQKISPDAAAKLAPLSALLAGAEGLEGHKNAAMQRLKSVTAA